MKQKVIKGRGGWRVWYGEDGRIREVEVYEDGESIPSIFIKGE